jgi:hypothetical protein
MRGFIAFAHLCAPIYVLAMMAVIFVPMHAAPYTGHGPRGTYVEPVAEKSEKLLDRLPVHAVSTIAYRLDPPIQKIALTSEAGLPWPCETIRNAVASLTPQQIERLARIYRLTDLQRADARKCLAAKRTERRDKRCDGPARYEAMSEGANCS